MIMMTIFTFSFIFFTGGANKIPHLPPGLSNELMKLPARCALVKTGARSEKPRCDGFFRVQKHKVDRKIISRMLVHGLKKSL